MRELTGHRVNPANDKLVVTVVDEPGSGGANHLYQVAGFNTATNPSWPKVWDTDESSDEWYLIFQNGPIAEVGVNGVTHEALLAILIDRLEGFQAGPYASADNQDALDAMRVAQTALQRRTLKRMARGVEGTHQV